MKYFTNPDINRLAVHAALTQLAYGFSGVFSAVFLLRVGLPIAAIFLVFAAILALRFVCRPIMLRLVPAIGLRRGLILGSLLVAAQYPALGPVHGAGPALAVYCVLAALSGVVYWPCFHTVFAARGDNERRGSHVGMIQALGTAASVASPVLGGLVLTQAGPYAAFGISALIETAAIVPLLTLREPPVALTAPPGAYLAAKDAVLLFATDGCFINAALWAWQIIVFDALARRYDAYGGVLAAAALAGAIGGIVLGRLIDLGHFRRAVRINAALISVSVVIRVFCGDDPLLVIVVAVGAAMLGGLYYLPLMTTIYNKAKLSPCPFRFHLATEGGWDVGGALCCALAAALAWGGAPLHALISLALPAVLLQALLLDRNPASRPRPAPGAAADTSASMGGE